MFGPQTMPSVLVNTKLLCMRDELCLMGIVQLLYACCKLYKRCFCVCPVLVCVLSRRK